MKIKNVINMAAGAFAAVALLASCSGNDSSSDKKISLEDYKDMTVGDSLAYYFGQLQSTAYWQMAAADSTFKTQEARDQFMKGLRAGFDAVQENEAYNRGLYQGVQLAMQMKEVEKDYGTTVSKKILMDAYQYGLRSDSAVNPSEVNEEFMKVQESMDARKEAADRKEAIEVLKKEATAKKWSRINDLLYASAATAPGQGALIKNGDAVSASILIQSITGVQIDRREDMDVTVGQMLPGPITQALQSMKIGEERTFYTTAAEVFGRAYARYGMKAQDVIEIKIKAGKAAPKPAPAADEAGN